ncbi:MAG TPA: hypothetical protein VJ836_03965 [Candidatus Saccharimonadales bacterium]|nr:hypothetical protein [Candidatus Saccharimonadales bacterium]
MEKLVNKLQQAHPDLLFTPGETACWSPGGKQIFYNETDQQPALAGLLHELGHARLGHSTYHSDMELLKKEVQAWEEAKRLAQEYDVILDDEHIEDCLDTYRNWLYKRSLCPTCQTTGLQKHIRRYICLNCNQTWQVTSARFCRPYRRSKTAKKENTGQ